MLANLQLLPLPLFGTDYDDGGRGAELAHHIDKVLGDSFSRPLIIGGDFNFNTPAKVFPQLFTDLSLHEALPDELTRPNKEGVKKTPDHLLYSDDLACVDSSVVPVQADHYLCVATFSY